MDKKQTALDYYSKKIGKLTADLVTGRITGKQFVMLEIKLLTQAKEMEKKQHWATWVNGVANAENEKLFQDHWNETYGGNK
jgi:hypothetical protein